MNEDRRLAEGLGASLAKAPTFDQYKKVMGPFWNHSTNTVIYLREFDIGFQAEAFLLNLTEKFSPQLTAKQYQINKYRLWYFHLKLLDKTDRWDDVLAALKDLKNDPSVKLPDEMFPHKGSPHLTEELYWQHRRKIVQRKIDRKSVEHLRHEQQDELSHDEYRRRIEVLKFWFEQVQIAEAQIRRMYEERRKRDSQ